jgi:hypothetical protein
MSEQHPRRRRVSLDATGTHVPAGILVDIGDLDLILAGRPVTQITAGVAAALCPAAVARAERPNQEPTEATIRAALRSILAEKLAVVIDPIGDGTRYVLPGGAIWVTAEEGGAYAVRFPHAR